MPKTKYPVLITIGGKNLTAQNTPTIVEALTHQSAVRNQDPTTMQSNGRFTILGIALYGMLATEELIRCNAPCYDFGRIRNNIFDAKLTELSEQLDLWATLTKAEGEFRDDPPNNYKNLRDRAALDALYAVFAAIYLDWGISDLRHVLINEVFRKNTS